MESYLTDLSGGRCKRRAQTQAMARAHPRDREDCRPVQGRLQLVAPRMHVCARPQKRCYHGDVFTRAKRRGMQRCREAVGDA